MKKSTPFQVAIVLACFSFSCQENSQIEVHDGSLQKLTIDNLRALERADSDAQLIATLKDGQGNLVSAEKLKPDSEYIILVEGTAGSELFIRNQEGFTVLSSKTDGEKIKFLIKTDHSLLGKLYLSIIPVVKENGILKKQNISNFLLPL